MIPAYKAREPWSMAALACFHFSQGKRFLKGVSAMSKYTKEDIIRMVREDDVEFIRNRYKDFYVLPVEVKFMKDMEEDFNQMILSYVQKNSRTSTLKSNS